MREDLLHYYERELTFLRRMGAEFAQRYPKVAGRLLLEPNKCDDPHVERMLEAFAFLAARVHLRIDDDFPEISEALLNVVYPHYVRPIPAISIAEFKLDSEQGKLTTGYNLPRGTMLYSRPVEGMPCKFQTSYDVTLWPLNVTAAEWKTPDRLRPPARLGDAVAVLRLELRCQPDVTFAKLALDTLRFYIDGAGNLTSALYELLNTSGREIVVREGGGGRARRRRRRCSRCRLRRSNQRDSDPTKASFRTRAARSRRTASFRTTSSSPRSISSSTSAASIRSPRPGLGGAIEILIPVPAYERTDWRPMLEAGVTQSTFRPGCTPIVNLFPHVSEPIILTQRRPEYPLIADARRRLTTEIFSVDDVAAVTPDSEQTLRFRPFYGPSRAPRVRQRCAARGRRVGKRRWIVLAGQTPRERMAERRRHRHPVVLR